MISSARQLKASGMRSGRYLEWYIEEPLVAQNAYLLRPAQTDSIPSFKNCRQHLPNPIWPANPTAIEAYWQTWKLAWKNLKRVSPESGFVSNYIDTAFNDCLFMWDSAFIVQFGRYGEHAFPFQNTRVNTRTVSFAEKFESLTARTNGTETARSPLVPTCSHGPSGSTSKITATSID